MYTAPFHSGDICLPAFVDEPSDGGHYSIRRKVKINLSLVISIIKDCNT